MQLEFELTYYGVAIQHISLYASGTTPTSCKLLTQTESNDDKNIPKRIYWYQTAAISVWYLFLAVNKWDDI